MREDLSPFSCRHVHENILPSITHQLKNIFIFNGLRFFIWIVHAICQLPMNESQAQKGTYFIHFLPACSSKALIIPASAVSRI